MLPDRDPFLEAAVLSLIFERGHEAVGALRASDLSVVKFRIDVEHFASAVHRAVWSKLTEAIRSAVHGRFCLDPAVIRSQLLDAGDPKAADAVMEIVKVPARLENARWYVDRLEELRQRREAARAEARRERLADASAREVREVGPAS